MLEASVPINWFKAQPSEWRAHTSEGAQDDLLSTEMTTTSILKLFYSYSNKTVNLFTGIDTTLLYNL